MFYIMEIKNIYCAKPHKDSDRTSTDSFARRLFEELQERPSHIDIKKLAISNGMLLMLANLYNIFLVNKVNMVFINTDNISKCNL